MTVFRKSLPCDIDAMTDIWRICFGDSEEIIRYFFDCGFESYVAVSENNVIAMLHFMKTEFSLKNDMKNGVYLYAAATLPEYRNRGVMRKLLRFAERDVSDKGVKFICLMPADEGLFEFYERLGYRKFFKTRFVTVKRAELEKDFKIAGSTTKYSFDIIANLRFNIYWKRAAGILYDADYMKFAVKMYEHYGARFICGKSGYLLYRDSADGNAEVLELAAEQGEYGMLLGEMLKNSKSDSFLFRLPADSGIFPNRGEVRYTGVIKSFAELNPESAEPYMGLTLD